MENRIHVRKARPSDVGRIARFNQNMARETEGRELNLERVERGVRHILRHPEDGFYLVASVDDKAVAVLMVTREWSDWRNAHFWWVQSVYVEPERRRSGIFRQLYDHVRRRAREEAKVCGVRLYVDAGNETAQKVYEALGLQQSNYVLYEAPMSSDSKSDAG